MESFEEFAKHPCTPRVTASGRCLLVIGTNGEIVVYNFTAESTSQKLELHEYEGSHSSACFSPCGDMIIIGERNTVTVFQYNTNTASWNRILTHKIENLYDVSCLAWKPDGSKIVVGTVSGGVELFDFYLHRTLHRKSFEFTYVNQSSVIVKTLMTGSRLVLKSVYGLEILKTKIYQNKFIAAHTPETLLLGNLETCALSEIQWNHLSNEKERFYFENDKGCALFCFGEIYVVEFGRNEILGLFPVRKLTPYTLSLVINESRKMIGYLIDAKTIEIHCLGENNESCEISHPIKIDWLEINNKGTHVIFRNKQRSLFIHSIPFSDSTNKKGSVHMLENCQYAQWVPESDVIVGQTDGSLFVWYNIEEIKAKQIVEVDGQAEAIVRDDNKTEVIISTTSGRTSVILDESLIAFSSKHPMSFLILSSQIWILLLNGALESRDVVHCLELLRSLEVNPETLTQWKQVAEVALSESTMQDKAFRQQGLSVAIECYKTLGHKPRVNYLEDIMHLAESLEEGFHSNQVLVRVLLLRQQWKKAEELLLKDGKLESVLKIVAREQGHPELCLIKKQYFDWLIQTEQDFKAAKIKEMEQDYDAAISLYLNSGLPMKAAKVILNTNYFVDNHLISSVLNSLKSRGFFECAGDLLIHLERYEEAKEMFAKDHCYEKLSQLCQIHFPNERVEIEKQWGDHLVLIKNYEAAVEHYIQSGNNKEAMDAALSSKDLNKAAEILAQLDESSAREPRLKLARRFAKINKLKKAEGLFVSSNDINSALEMYKDHKDWDSVFRLAHSHLPVSKQKSFFICIGNELELNGDLNKAERAFLLAEDVDEAVEMYKRHRDFNSLIKLIKSEQADSLNETYTYIGEQMEAASNYHEAEKYYSCCNNWKAILEMYKTAGLWEDAIRVAQTHNDVAVLHQVAFECAQTALVAGSQSALQIPDLIDDAINHALQNGLYSDAESLANSFCPDLLPEIHLRYAMHLEDEGFFDEASECFIKAGKPQEALDMFVHSQEWDKALTIAEKYTPTSVVEIYSLQAQSMAEKGDLYAAEELFLKARSPVSAVEAYLEAGLNEEALRVAEMYVPSKLQSVHLHIANHMDKTAVDKMSRNQIFDTNYATLQIMNKAESLEKGCDFQGAMELYLSLDVETTKDHTLLQKAWGNAMRICATHVPGRIEETCAVVTSRLMKIHQFQAAADIYRSLNDHKGIVKCLCFGGMYEEAKSACKGDLKLTAFVEESEIQTLVQEGDIDGLTKLGRYEKVLEIYMTKNDWSKVHEVAKCASREVQIHYSMTHAMELWREGNLEDTLEILSSHGTSDDTHYTKFYLSLAQRVLQMSQVHQKPKTVRNLSLILHKVVDSDLVGKGSEMDILVPYYKASNLLHLLTIATEQGLTEIAAKQGIVLLKYIPMIPPDKAFFLAGWNCKSAGMKNMAVVFLNRYLDIIDAIEEGNLTPYMDNSPFENTEIPLDDQLPNEQYLDEKTRETVRDWILAVSLDSQLTNTLDTSACSECDVETFIGNQFCHNCKLSSVSEFMKFTRSFLSSLHGKPLDLLYAFLVHRILSPRSFFSRGWGDLPQVEWLQDLTRGSIWPPPLITIPWKVLESGDHQGTRFRVLEGQFTSPTSSSVWSALPSSSHRGKVRLLLPMNSLHNQISLVLHLAGTGDHGFNRRMNLGFTLLQYNIASMVLESPFYGSRKPPDQFGSRLRHVSDLLTLGRATIEESLALLYWAKGNGFGPLGVCGLSMGGVHSCMVASLYPGGLACTPLLTPRSAAVAFCQGALQHGISNWNELKKSIDQNNRDIQSTQLGVDRFAILLNRMRSCSIKMPQLSWMLSNYHDDDDQLPELLSKYYSNSSLFYADDNNLDGTSVLTLMEALERHEARRRLQMVLELFTDITQFPIPRRPDAAVFVAARNDAYALPDSAKELHQYWKGSELRWVSGGHVSSVLFHARAFCDAIRDSLMKLNNVDKSTLLSL
eukprot:g3472.t1